MRNFDNYVPDELRVWLKLNGESINYVCKAPLNGTIKINTEKHKYLYYPDRDELLIEIKKEILTKSHSSPFSVYPGSTKMYKDVKQHFWWPKMKREIAEWVARCLVCQQVKAELQRPGGLLQSLPVPEWKWEHIKMDFLLGLP